MTVSPTRAALAALVLAGALSRGAFFAWDHPWTAHHPDEHILSLEAMALWEGITPREVGWPASTVRLALSGVHGVQMLANRRAALLSARSHPPAVLDVAAAWIGDRYVAPGPLYAAGRIVSALIGL